MLERKDNRVGKVYAGRRGTQTMLEKYTRKGEEDNRTQEGDSWTRHLKTRSEKLRHACAKASMSMALL